MAVHVNVVEGETFKNPSGNKKILCLMHGKSFTFTISQEVQREQADT